MEKEKRARERKLATTLTLLAITPALLCLGCAGGIYSRFAELELKISSPLFGGEDRIPVFYPGRESTVDSSMVQAYGPSWRGVERDFPAYNFNP